MYVCRDFDIHELVPKSVFERFGVNAWQFLNPIALQGLDGLRDFFGKPIICNTWHRGGKFQFRGFRPADCTVGAPLSQHRLGNAFDLDIRGLSAEDARQAILHNADDPRLALITCIEADVNWLHVDFRNIPDRIRVVKP